MSAYEEATRELARLRKRINISPSKMKEGVIDSTPKQQEYQQSYFKTYSSNHRFDSSFLSSDLPNASVSRLESFHNATNTSSNREYEKKISGTYYSGPGPNDSLPYSGSKSAPMTSSDEASSSVIAAFRELQSQVKVLESERFEAYREREDLKNKVMEFKRNSSLQRSRFELENTETLLTSRAHSDKLQREVEEYQAKFRAKEEISESMERKLKAQKVFQLSLEEDITRNQQRILSMERHLNSLKQEMMEIGGRVEEVEEVAATSPDANRKSELRVLQTVESLEKQLNKVKMAKVRVTSKITSLRSYIDLVIRINGELCETLLARERLKSKVLNLSRSLSPPPRYTWPKEVPHDSFLQVINESAKASAEAAVEKTALEATESALKSVRKAFSPAKQPKSVLFDDNDSNVSDGYNEPADTVAMNNYYDRASSLLKHSSIENSVDDMQTEVLRSMERLAVFAGHVSGDKRGSNKPKSHTTSPSHSPLRESRHGSGEKPSSSYLNLSDSSSESIELPNSSRYFQSQTGKLINFESRKVKKRSKKTKKTKITSSSNLSAREAAQMISTANEVLNDIRRKKSMNKVLARQGAITSATRLAAAATAATNAMKVVQSPTNSPPLTRPRRSRSSSSTRSRPRSSASSNGRVQHRVDFIPSSCPASSEFNIIASVSKASRAAKELNATIASKVKSLHSTGAGTIFDEVPRISLSDLQGQLRAVKTLRDSFVDN